MAPFPEAKKWLCYVYLYQCYPSLIEINLSGGILSWTASSFSFMKLSEEKHSLTGQM